MGIANKRSIAFGVAKVLDRLGAKLVFTYRKERSRKELEKLLEQLNQSEHHLYEIDVQNDEDIINGFSQIGKDVGQIDGVYHSIAFANMEDLRGRFSETSREGFLLAQEISSYSLTLVAEDNIRVNAISAGPIRTLSAKGVGGFNTILKEIEARAPLKRNVDQEEVGKTAAYLLSDLSSGVTGENIHVDGGFHAIK